MGTTYATSLGDRGRLVIPADLRASQDWKQGDSLLFIEADDGVVVTTPDQALSVLRKQLAGESLVEGLLADRRAASLLEDQR